MVKAIAGERWKKIQFYQNSFGNKYAISNMGRLVCFHKNINDGHLLNCSLQEGYPIWRFRRKRKNGSITYEAPLLHRLVASYFLSKPQRGETIVIHSNYKKSDNRYHNLQWASPDEAFAHQQGSPAVKRLKKNRKETFFVLNAKLNSNKVTRVKIMLKQNKTLKEIASRFGVSDMQVHRIKTGENWSHVTI
jgi:hypothetical protein